MSPVKPYKIDCFVIPAKAGTQQKKVWFPAFAGTTPEFRGHRAYARLGARNDKQGNYAGLGIPTEWK